MASVDVKPKVSFPFLARQSRCTRRQPPGRRDVGQAKPSGPSVLVVAEQDQKGRGQVAVRAVTLGGVFYSQSR